MWIGLTAIVAALAVASVLGVLQRRARFRRAAPGTAEAAVGPLAEADLGVPLGNRATLVQFSTAFCTPCRAARQVLGRVADTVSGVEHVEIDATARMDLVRQFKITATPTVLILGPGGAVARRATGVPRAGDVMAALDELELSSKSAGNDRHAVYLGSDSSAGAAYHRVRAFPDRAKAADQAARRRLLPGGHGHLYAALPRVRLAIRRASARLGSTSMEIDPRGPRFAAVVTSVVLVAVLLTGSGVLLAVQALIFAIGAIAGLRYAPYGALYRTLIRPRLGPPASTEPETPPRFAQGVGMVFAIVGAVGYLTGVTALGIVFTAFALVAAFANAAFDYCLGCQMYLYIQRVRPSHGRV